MTEERENSCGITGLKMKIRLDSNTSGKNFYITTTLPYVNADLHIGHAMEFVYADIVARYKRLLGFIFF